MFTKGLLTLTTALAFSSIALVVACADDSPASGAQQSVKEEPVKAATDTKPAEPAPASSTAAATPAPAASADAGSSATKADAAEPPGLDPTDCATQEGQACFQCCVDNNGGANNDIGNCVANCAN